MKRRRIKKQVYYVLAGLILFIIVLTFLIKHINYIHSYEYKLSKLGYDSKQIEVLLKLDNNNLEDLIKRKYNKNFSSFVKQKYFIYKNLDRYLSYQKDNKSEKLSTIVSLVNVNADYDAYDKKIIKDTDINKKELMLINKYYHLNKDYVPEDLTDASVMYSYSDNSATSDTLKAFKELWENASKNNINLVITSSYRSYDIQDKIWNNYAFRESDEEADLYVARAGYSEYQSGLALDITLYKGTKESFKDSTESKWLQDNAYKYGFILRYPKDKEKITGYDYDQSHYRYVGKKIAKVIHDEKITFDEYYAYYIENKD